MNRLEKDTHPYRESNYGPVALRAICGRGLIPDHCLSFELRVLSQDLNIHIKCDSQFICNKFTFLSGKYLIILHAYLYQLNITSPKF
jgi:hypothetical protein